jgi:hypothetical protein
MTPEELDVAAAPLSLSETHHNDNDPQDKSGRILATRSGHVLGRRTASSAAPTNEMTASTRAFISGSLTDGDESDEDEQPWRSREGCRSYDDEDRCDARQAAQYRRFAAWSMRA